MSTIPIASYRQTFSANCRIDGLDMPLSTTPTLVDGSTKENVRRLPLMHVVTRHHVKMASCSASAHESQPGNRHVQRLGLLSSEAIRICSSQV